MLSRGTRIDVETEVDEYGGRLLGDDGTDDFMAVLQLDELDRSDAA